MKRVLNYKMFNHGAYKTKIEPFKLILTFTFIKCNSVGRVILGMKAM